LDAGSVRNAVATFQDSAVMVPIKNFSTNYISYEYEFRGQKRRLELDVSGRKMISSVPLEIWEDIERNTVFVSEGYIARTDKPLTNPNIIDDPEALVNNLSEAQFANRVKEMTNASAIYKLVAFLEPLKEKTGKQLSAQKAVRKRILELTDVVIVDSDTEDA
jgi:hypothetical protein